MPAHSALAIDQIDHGNTRYPVRTLYRVIGVEHGESIVVLVDKWLHRIVVHIRAQRQYPQARIGVLAMEGFYMGQLFYTGATPGRPEIDQHYLSPIIGEADLGTVQSRQRKIRRGFAIGHGRFLCHAPLADADLPTTVVNGDLRHQRHQRHGHQGAKDHAGATVLRCEPRRPICPMFCLAHRHRFSSLSKDFRDCSSAARPPLPGR